MLPTEGPLASARPPGPHRARLWLLVALLATGLVMAAGPADAEWVAAAHGGSTQVHARTPCKQHHHPKRCRHRRHHRRHHHRHHHAATTKPTRPPAAPAGQRVGAGLLTGDAATFTGSTGGWSAYGAATVEHDSTAGHAAPGALRVTVTGARTGARSPAFPVVPGDRYAGVVAERAQVRSQMSAGIEFLAADGSVLAGATQVAQAVNDWGNGWVKLHVVMGIAPPNAASADLFVVDQNGAVGGGVSWIDDALMLRVSGSPAPIVGPLRTSGRYVLDARGRRVTLRGVTLGGLETTPTAQVPTSEVDIAWRWGANFVRIPLAENYWLGDDCLAVAGYQDHVDALVRTATAHGMFVLLDLHRNSHPECTLPQQQKMPDMRSVVFWKQVAARYAANPLVGFELYNEPHDVSAAVWRDGGTIPVGVAGSFESPGMQGLYDAVRSTGADNLVFASGMDWAGTFPAAAPLRDAVNVVYGVHTYTCPHGTALPQTCSTGPDGSIYDGTGAVRRFLSAAPDVPVMLTEFGFPDRQDERFFPRTIAYAESKGIVGWSAYAFDNTTLGAYDLWRTPGPTAEPAPAGMAVMRRLARD